MYKPDQERLRLFWSALQDVWLKLYGSSFPTAAAINVTYNCIEFFMLRLLIFTGSCSGWWLSFSFVLWIPSHVPKLHNRSKRNTAWYCCTSIFPGNIPQCSIAKTGRKSSDFGNDVYYRWSTQSKEFAITVCFSFSITQTCFLTGWTYRWACSRQSRCSSQVWAVFDGIQEGSATSSVLNQANVAEKWTFCLERQP